MTRPLPIALALALASASGLASAGAPTDHQRIVAFPSRDGVHHAYHEWTYAHAVRVGDMIWVSGVPGRGKTQPEQVRSALDGVRKAIEAAGGSMDDVVELMSFHTALDPATFESEVAAVRREFFPAGFTAWTAVGTTALLAPGSGVEIRAVAVVGSGKRKDGVPPAPAAPKE